MTNTFKDLGSGNIGDVLAFIDTAVSEGSVAAVPAIWLPLLARSAYCRPSRSGELKGCFVFRFPTHSHARSGIIERAVAVLALVALSPLLGAISLLILLFDGSPILFRQERFGRDGAPFTLLKFRTMLRRSENLQEKLQRKQSKQGHLFKLENDPRVTRFGGFLRRTFLDELPQLVNVIRGEMGLIGPRPLPASDGVHYTRSFHALRLKGLPGMTGLWQVSGRNERTFDEMCLLDFYYVCNRSAALDARIAWRTLCLLFTQISLKREA